MNNKGVVITGCDTGNENVKNLSIFYQKQKNTGLGLCTIERMLTKIIFREISYVS